MSGENDLNILLKKNHHFQKTVDLIFQRDSFQLLMSLTQMVPVNVFSII